MVSSDASAHNESFPHPGDNNSTPDALTSFHANEHKLPRSQEISLQRYANFCKMVTIQLVVTFNFRFL